MRVRPTAQREAGSGVVLVLGLAAVFLGLVLAIAALGAVTAARHRAESAADLAALAAASAGTPTGCSRAAEVAAASGAWVIECRPLADGSVLVRAGTALPPWLAALAEGRQPVGVARAGARSPPVPRFRPAAGGTRQ
jgi:secretion/DNA translocation related TadE-like protein